VIEYPTFVLALINNQCEDPIKELLNRFPLHQAISIPVLPKKQNNEESFGISSIHQSDPSHMNLSSSSSSRGEGGRGSGSFNDGHRSRGGRGQGRGGWQGGESREKVEVVALFKKYARAHLLFTTGFEPVPFTTST
jgi:hypothetical protein